MQQIFLSDWFTKCRCSNLFGLTSLDRSQKSVFSIFYRLSGIIFIWKLYQKMSRIFLNPDIVFVCGNHEENKNGSTFLFSKIENTCNKIGIWDLHLVELRRIVIFQISPKSNFIFVFERFAFICKAKRIKNYLWDHWYFLKNLAILNIFLPKSHVSNFGKNYSWNFKQKPLYSLQNLNKHLFLPNWFVSDSFKDMRLQN